MVSLFTKSGVGRDTICTKGSGFQIVGSVPTGKVTGLTSKKGGTQKCSIPIVVEDPNVPCEFWSRWVVTVVGLILFLGGCSSRGKTKEAGWVAFFLKTGEFLHFSVSWGVALNSVLNLSNLVDADVNTGGGENSHLSSLRNAWGNVGVLLVVHLILLLKVPLLSLAKGSRVGKDHSPSERLSYYFHCQFLIHPVNYPCCIHFSNVNPSFGFLIKRIPDELPCYIPRVLSP